MPELPEVETTRQGIAPLVENQTIAKIVIHQAKLRWPIPGSLRQKLPGQSIRSVTRRAKYLLFNTSAGTLLIHLGMSGSLRLVPQTTPRDTHDHFELVLTNRNSLRLRDPRRFGAVLWAGEQPEQHKLLAGLGPEPLEHHFTGDYLYRCSRRRTRAIRDFLLDGHVVAGIGNIYANEALFTAGIRPTRPAGRISRDRYQKLVRAIRSTLRRAIKAGGTSIRDFRQADGRPGYFQHSLKIYGKKGEPCPKCGQKIRAVKLTNRTVFFCTHCQL
jgi:formamidopyrimidine-DNA glycosylase